MALRPCTVLANHASAIRREWAAFIAESEQRGSTENPSNAHAEDGRSGWPQLSALHADSHLSAGNRWEMLYLRRGNGSGGFLSPVCGDGGYSDGSNSAPFRETCALLSRLEEVSWALQPLALRPIHC